MRLRRLRRRRPEQVIARESHSHGLRVHPEFHRHLLLVCLVVILSWALPGPLVQLGSAGSLYLTVLLGLRLGPIGLKPGRVPLSPVSVDTHYLLLAVACCGCQLLWLFAPISLGWLGLPLLALFTLFMAWSILRLLKVLSNERRIDGRTLCGATAGYLLLGISGGLVLTVLDTVMPGGFHDILRDELLRMPQVDGFSIDKIAWDQNYGRLNYFAFVSLTTLGFGDITPVLPATRLACLALSVLGPLYIAVVLGVLISRLSAGVASAPPQGQRRRPESSRLPSRASLDPSRERLRPPPPPVRSRAPARPDPGPGGSEP